MDIARHRLKRTANDLYPRREDFITTARHLWQLDLGNIRPALARWQAPQTISDVKQAPGLDDREFHARRRSTTRPAATVGVHRLQREVIHRRLRPRGRSLRALRDHRGDDRHPIRRNRPEHQVEIDASVNQSTRPHDRVAIRVIQRKRSQCRTPARGVIEAPRADKARALREGGNLRTGHHRPRLDILLQEFPQLCKERVFLLLLADHREQNTMSRVKQTIIHENHPLVQKAVHPAEPAPTRRGDSDGRHPWMHAISA